MTQKTVSLNESETVFSENTEGVSPYNIIKKTTHTLKQLQS
jgi:hypothetical protein